MALNCRNCGGPLTVVPNHDYFVCKFCGAFTFPETQGEGVEVRVLGEPSDLSCPVCQQQLVSAAVAGAMVLHCRRCRGLLMTPDAFAAVVEHRRARADGPPDPPQPLDPRELERQLTCPSCRQLMDTHPYYGPGNVVVDVCAACKLVWLDHDELNVIVNAPGPDRGTRIGRTSND